MSEAENKQMPVINAESADNELHKVASEATIQAFIGQRDEALARAADLYTQLRVTQHVAAKLEAENKDLKLDIDALKKSAGMSPAE